MADIPLLTPMPDPPLPTDAEAIFDEKAGIYLTAEKNLVNVDLNTKLIPGINAATQQISADVESAAQSATTATEQAAIAAGAGGAAAEQVALAQQQVVLASQQAVNAANSAAAAEAAGGLGSIAILHAISLSL